MTNDLINELLRHLPDSPGVYLMRNAAGEILYVGKAANLHNRVKSYFTSQQLSPKTQALVERVNDFEYIITSSEQEALILELNLIKIILTAIQHLAQRWEELSLPQNCHETWEARRGGGCARN